MQNVLLGRVLLYASLICRWLVRERSADTLGRCCLRLRLVRASSSERRGVSSWQSLPDGGIFGDSVEPQRRSWAKGEGPSKLKGAQKYRVAE